MKSLFGKDLLKENGNPVDGEITSIAAVVDGGSTSMVPLEDFSAAQIGQGIYEVSVPLDRSLHRVKLFFIQASYTENSNIINGSKLFP